MGSLRADRVFLWVPLFVNVSGHTRLADSCSILYYGLHTHTHTHECLSF